MSVAINPGSLVMSVAVNPGSLSCNSRFFPIDFLVKHRADVFNALDITENKTIFEELKCYISVCKLHALL